MCTQSYVSRLRNIRFSVLRAYFTLNSNNWQQYVGWSRKWTKKVDYYVEQKMDRSFFLITPKPICTILLHVNKYTKSKLDQSVKTGDFTFALTSPNIDWFSEFFQWRTWRQIWRKLMTKGHITSCRRRCTAYTSWNICSEVAISQKWVKQTAMHKTCLLYTSDAADE